VYRVCDLDVLGGSIMIIESLNIENNKAHH
jgi:hypothetical protein